MEDGRGKCLQSSLLLIQSVSDRDVIRGDVVQDWGSYQEGYAQTQNVQSIVANKTSE